MSSGVLRQFGAEGIDLDFQSVELAKMVVDRAAAEASAASEGPECTMMMKIAEDYPDGGD